MSTLFRIILLACVCSVATLTRAQADLDAGSKFVSAAARGDVETLRACIASGINLELLAEPASDSGDEMTALMAAAANGRTEAMLILLFEGASLDTADASGKTALHWAASSNQDDAVGMLLEAGAGMHIVNESGYNAAALAVLHGASESLRVLLAAGGDPNEMNVRGTRLLRQAARTYGESFANIRVVNELLRAGADASLVNRDGSTALFGAVDQTPGSLLFMHTLVAAGADPLVADEDGRTIVDLAARRNAPVISAYLRGDAPVVAQAELLRATAAGDLEAVRRALNEGADANAGTRGNSFYGEEAEAYGTADGGPLHLVALVGAAPALVEALVDAGAVPNGVNESGSPPLKIAADRGDIAMVRALLAAGADADGTDVRPFLGLEPIHWAAMNGSTDVIEALLAAGANPAYTTNATMGYGYNALGYAVHRGHLEAVALLLNAGSDVSIAGETEDSPMDIAVREGWTEIADLLREDGGMTNSEAANHAAEEIIAATPPDRLWEEVSLARDPAVIGAILDRGMTPPSDFLRSVMYTVYDDPDLVQRLIDAGANLNATGGMADPTTMLYEAAANGHSDFVAQLLEAGADPEIRGPDGRTPREIAEEYEQYDVLDIFQMRDD